MTLHRCMYFLHPLLVNTYSMIVSDVGAVVFPPIFGCVCRGGFCMGYVLFSSIEDN